ncbi:hypothetical protein I541_5545 [Mycobacteroides abscessus]|nr:hypothetical protein I541_5545 [Mycobacteroides abscessus]
MPGLPSWHTINRIRYFTAKVTPTPNDPDIGNRQQVYLRALRTLPSVSIHEGHFLRHKRSHGACLPSAQHS